MFKSEERDLAAGDRIQWRLVNHDLGIRNADRGTVQALEGMIATIRWDRDGRVQAVDLSEHKTWDHGYAETVYSAQSKTFDRVYVLAPVASPLVTGQNYYTAITRAQFGVKLWTEDEKRLIEKLERHSGEKTSALEGLGRLDRDSLLARDQRHGDRLDLLRVQQRSDRADRKARMADERDRREREPDGVAALLAGRALSIAQAMDRWMVSLLDRAPPETGRDQQAAPTPAPHEQPSHAAAPDHGGDHDH